MSERSETPEAGRFRAFRKACGCAAVFAVLCAAGAPVDLGPLTDGREHVLRGGETHRFDLELGSGEYVHLAVEQAGVDLVAVLFDPGGRELRVDSPNGSQGPEHVHWLVHQSGRHHLELRGSGVGGRYVVRIRVRRPATGDDVDLAGAALTFAQGESLRRQGGEALPAAMEYYGQALRIWQRLGRSLESAITRYRLGQTRVRLGEIEDGIREFLAARYLVQGGEHRSLEVELLGSLGSAYRLGARPEEARAAYAESLELARQAGYRSGEAIALNNLALLLDDGGRFLEALDYYRKAADAFRELGRPAWVAVTLTNMASAYALAGQLEEALDVLGESEELRRAAGDRRGLAVSLTGTGWVHYLRGDPEEALPVYEAALTLAAQEPALVAEIRDRRATALIRLGRLDEALADSEEAFAWFEEHGPTVYVAHVASNLSRLHEARGEVAKAWTYFERARDIFRASGDLHGEAATLFVGARIERRRGRLEESRLLLEEVLSRVESVRAAASSPALKLSLQDTRHDYYEAYVDLLMELHRRDPAADWDERALDAAERTRARTLLELVTGVDLAEPFPTPRIQSEVLDDETTLLVYFLGAERSFLWRVTVEEVDVHVLPGREVIEHQARRVYELMKRSQSRGASTQARLAAVTLAETILGPVAQGLDRPRIAVLGDGALQSIPFAVLPKPAADGGARAPGRPLLLDEHEVVHLPSASVLAALRRGAAAGALGTGVAVIADPLYSPHGTWSRLPYTRQEAEMILALVPDGEKKLYAVGEAANRDLVVSGGLDGYGIVHIASHAVVDAEHPERSRLVLSQVDGQGRPIEGRVFAPEIYRLELSAKLVVLSACQTALGREFRGEGLVGLTQGFLNAGAPRVVVSLWSVDDRATAELMARFYRGVLGEGLAPAAALRAAQRSLRSEPRWAAPYFWAGFVLQGEWR